MFNFITYLTKRLLHAFAGIFYALTYDLSFRIQFYLGSFFIMTCFYSLWPLTQTESLFLLLGWFLILITELQNSSLETALDRLHPDTHGHIGRSKDMAAGAVLIAGSFLGIVFLTILNNHLELI